MIYPKCENAQRLYVTSGSQVRPCCWLGERGNIQQNYKWNLKHNSIENILEVELKEFVNNLKKDPEKWAQKTCYEQCGKPFTAIAKPTENWVVFKE
tara:strand:- start:554 stop:841 length:288 start_codon:yes stop_codon:yes gene_type:complete